jgi:hypothetical protein
MDWTRQTTAIVGGLFLIVVGMIVAIAVLNKPKPAAEIEPTPFVTGSWTCVNEDGPVATESLEPAVSQMSGEIVSGEFDEKMFLGRFTTPTTIRMNVYRKDDPDIEFIDCWVGGPADRPERSHNNTAP